jgi:hypothetical protein
MHIPEGKGEKADRPFRWKKSVKAIASQNLLSYYISTLPVTRKS